MTTVIELMTLPSEHLVTATVFLAAIIATCEYVRIVLSVTAPKSVAVHLLVSLLTVVIQPLFLAAVLVLSIAATPERAWLCMAIVAGLYGVWYLAGQSSLLVRADSQGADVGFMTVGAVMTFIPGLITMGVM